MQILQVFVYLEIYRVLEYRILAKTVDLMYTSVEKREVHMDIYIDESGSINNKYADRVPYFIIALVHVTDRDALSHAYKRFVSKHQARLRELDTVRLDPKTGKLLRGGKMFRNGRFHELKGNAFDADMKRKFVDYFTRKPSFELFYIIIDNKEIPDVFNTHTANAFNYTLQHALRYFCNHKMLPPDICHLQLDERNEKSENRHFLENYLNTELLLEQVTQQPFTVRYFDSSRNQFVQIADVFSNLMYSQTQTYGYQAQIEQLKQSGVLKFIYKFPDSPT